MISSFSILFSQKFFRCANKGQKKTHLLKVLSNASLYLRVCDMPTVPCQQIIHTTDRGDRNVQRIFRSLGRHNSMSYKRLRDMECLLSDQEQRHIIQHSQPSPGCIWVTRATLTQYLL